MTSIFDIDYGCLPGGVFTAACPPEALHLFKLGLSNHCFVELFQEMITKLTQRKFDVAVQKWVLYSRQKHMKT